MKFVDFSASFFWKISFMAVLLVSSACHLNDDWNENKTFDDRYSQDIEKIKAARIDPSPSKLDLNAKLDFTAPVDRDTMRYTNSNVTVPEHYSSQQFANQTPQNPAFQNPSEMFENNYNPTIKSPFRKIGAEFDAIDVPNQDAYGVKIGVSDKEYLLVSRKLLQKNIDQINAQKTSDDVEDSETLISEQRNLKRKVKMIKIFGQNSVTAEEDSKSPEASKSSDMGDKVVELKKTSKAKKKIDNKVSPNSSIVKPQPQQNSVNLSTGSIPQQVVVSPNTTNATPTLPQAVPAGAAPGVAPATPAAPAPEVVPSIPTPPLPANNS